MVPILIINLRLRYKCSRERNFHVSKKSVTITINVMERKFHANFTLGNESSRGRKFRGTKVPGNESSRGRKFQGTKVPGNESSTYGTFVPGNESSRVRKFQLPIILAKVRSAIRHLFPDAFTVLLFSGHPVI